MSASFDFEKLNSGKPNVKYGFTKELLKTGETAPEKLYAYLEEIGKMAAHENNIIKWAGVDLLGYISSVDEEHKTDKYILLLLRYLHSGDLITVNHAIFTLGQMALYKFGHRNKILKQLISIKKDEFENEECKSIATGKVIDALTQFPSEIRKMKSAMDFIRDASANTRGGTAKKALKLLKSMQIELETGKTKSVGFEIGVRRSFPVTPVAAWDFLLSDEGVAVWLGVLTEGGLSMNHNYKTSEGVEGSVRVLKPYSHLRMTWKKNTWQNFSLLQLRVIAVKKNTTISFHQEKLLNTAQRGEMKKYWEKVLIRLNKEIK